MIAKVRNGFTRFHIWVALLGGVVALGFSAIVVGFVRGHEVSFNTSAGVPWGVLISTYVFFVVTASGLCLIPNCSFQPKKSATL